jgi:hypothetical protein
MKALLCCMTLACALDGQSQTTNLPSGIGITCRWTNAATVGSALSWRIDLTNAATSALTCRVTMDANALAYNGKFLGDVSTVFATNTLAAGATTSVAVTVAPIGYTKWLAKTRTFELSAFVSVEGLNERWIGSGRTVLTTTADILSVSPTLPIQQGHSLTGTVSYLNPLPVALHNVKVTMTADEGLSTNGAIMEAVWNVGTVPSNAWITVSTNYTAGQVGKHNISALVLAEEWKEVEGNAQVEVVAP